MKRNRIKYALIIIGIIVAGLCSRKFSDLLPDFIAEYAGDFFWAMMVYFNFGFLFVKMERRNIFLFAVLFSSAIEVSQLYHAHWIDYLRSTSLGGLALGYGFLWSDLVCYSAGIIAGLLIEMYSAKWIYTKII